MRQCLSHAAALPASVDDFVCVDTHARSYRCPRSAMPLASVDTPRAKSSPHAYTRLRQVSWRAPGKPPLDRVATNPRLIRLQNCGFVISARSETKIRFKRAILHRQAPPREPPSSGLGAFSQVALSREWPTRLQRPFPRCKIVALQRIFACKASKNTKSHFCNSAASRSTKRAQHTTSTGQPRNNPANRSSRQGYWPTLGRTPLTAGYPQHPPPFWQVS